MLITFNLHIVLIIINIYIYYKNYDTEIHQKKVY